MPTSTVVERAVPHNLEAERALLGSIILDNGALNLAVGTVGRDDFFSDSHRAIFSKMLELSEKSHLIDLVTLAEELSKEGLLEKLGGAAYLATLTDGVPVGNYSLVGEYCRIVKEKSLLRRLINASNNVIARCFEGVDEPEVLIDLAQSELFEIAGEKVRSGFFRPHEIVKSSFGTLDALADRGQRITGVETGFEELDSMLSGLQPSELIVLAARPSLGKTALALNIAAHAAQKGRVVGVFSLEMSKESLLMRLLCSEARIDSHKLRTGFASQQDWEKMAKALGRLAEAPLFIEDTPALSVLQIRAKARRLKAERGLDLLVVDYLQLATGHGRFENRTQEVSFISRSLKGIAKELNIPVLALSQLSRAPEQHGAGRPELWHLRESGSIEQDADVVIFIYRERRRDDEEDGQDPRAGVETKLIVGKQRNGPTGDVILVFLKPYVRFENPAFGEQQ
ncbi:MAG TPA: replicative DNA helicase [Terriglobia bacterium]|jgi:replicative DNA helicase|nr:replicative DNA helicase [Terriglobia bacterium]